MMIIRSGIIEDLPRLMEIYREARGIMVSCGNAGQWKPGHPSEEMIRQDIASGHCRVVESPDGTPVGAFAFIPGKDPTYDDIDGEWVDDTLPYCTIHRLASTGASKGVAGACFDWCWSQSRNLRVDTHEDNVIMRHCIEQAGFKYCGVIRLQNGDPRLAYQKIMTQKEETYFNLIRRCHCLCEGEGDWLANAANVVAEIHRTMGFLWTGIYRVINEDLVLGPFQGPVACTRIHKGRGVCGTAWEQDRSILVPDVDKFPGHIRCSGDARSEIVIPIRSGSGIIGVFDVDCDKVDGLDETDLTYLTKAIGAITD